MTKQQLREAIRKIIKQELNETVTGTEAEEIAKQAGSYEAAVKALMAKGTSYQYSNAVATEIYGEKVNEKLKTVPNPNAGKWRIVTADKKEKPLTSKFYDSKAEAEEASRKIGKTNAVGIKIIQLKDTMQVHENAPAPSNPTPSTKPTVAPGKPAEKKPRRPLGNPNVNPAPKATKATMKEAEMLKQVIKRFRSKK